MFQVVGLILLLVIVGFTLFYFIGSSGKLDREAYRQLVTYDNAGGTYRVGDTLRAVSYNIGYMSGMTNNRSVKREAEFFEYNLSQAKQLMSRMRPDVVGLQEIDFSSSRSFFTHQANEIGQEAGFLTAFHSVNWDKRYVPFPGGPVSNHFGSMLSGQSILSRYELQATDHIVLEQPINAPFYFKAYYIDRLIQTCDWLVGDQVIKVMNLHLEAFDKETRVSQAHRVREEYLKYYKDFPVIIMGDFNSKPDWKADDAMSVIMQSPDIESSIDQEQYELEPSQSFTFSSGSPSYMIDYILYNRTYIYKVGSGVMQDAGEISDHFPVYLDFVLKP